MDNILNKRTIVQDFLSEYNYLPNEDHPHLRHILTTDESSNHLLLTCTGWNDGLFSYYTVFHFELQEDGTIWVHENRTDDPLTEWFTKRGIPSADIIAAWAVEPQETILE